MQHLDKKRMAANQHNYTEDIYNLSLAPRNTFPLVEGRKHMEISKHTSQLLEFSTGPLD